MKIAQASIYPLSIPLIEPIKMAREKITSANTVLLCLTDTSGVQGWGEASTAPLMTGETLDSLLGNIKYLAEKASLLEWSDPTRFSESLDGILYANSSAKSCFSMALLDLFTQKISVPLWKYLRSTSGLADIETPAPIPLLRMLGGSLDKEQADAIQYRELGFSHWKIKVGSLSLEEDLHRVRVLCDALPDNIISVDANGAMSLPDAIRFCQSESAQHLSFAEQLIAANCSIKDFILLRNESPIPIGLDESIHGLAEISEFTLANAFDGASLKLIKTGGILEALACAGELKRSNLNLNLACKVAETSLSAAATASIGFAMGSVPWGFSMSNQYLQFDICKNPLSAKRGHIDVAQLNATGVGITPDPELLKAAIAPGYSIIQY